MESRGNGQASSSTAGKNANHQIHTLYVREDFDACLELIDAHLEQNSVAEYPLYVKALIRRQRGNIADSLLLFQAATALNPSNPENLKQVGRSLYLLGKHKAAIEVYNEAQGLSPEDWELWHHKGLCFMYLHALDNAVECFRRANLIQRHDVTYMQLGKAFELQKQWDAAVAVYMEALNFSPESCEVLTTIGLLHLRLGDNSRAFDYLGNSLTHDPRNAKTILAAGSIIQDHSDPDVALIKYRVAAVGTPNSAQLWNNIGMCFFGKQRHVAAIACLKKALYLDPFESIISYNLGLVHLHTGQYASAFHFLSSSINLKPEYGSAYLYLALTLSRLDDFENACCAYDKAIELDGAAPLPHLNYAITLYNNKEVERARQHFGRFCQLFDAQDGALQGDADSDVLLQRRLLGEALGVIKGH